MKTFCKELIPCDCVQKSALLALECCDHLWFEFDSDSRKISLYDLDRNFVGICQQDFVHDFCSLLEQGWDFSFSVEEIVQDVTERGRMEMDVTLRISAYCPGENIADIAEVAQNLRFN